MSKIYEKYLKLKLKDKDKIYLFKSGIFYIAIDNDAKILNNKYNLKLSLLNNSVVKCGFPVSTISKYEDMFKADDIDYIIVKDSDISLIIKLLERVDINTITGIEALNILKKMKDLL